MRCSCRKSCKLICLPSFADKSGDHQVWSQEEGRFVELHDDGVLLDGFDHGPKGCWDTFVGVENVLLGPRD
jgi:hypothetical protein